MKSLLSRISSSPILNRKKRSRSFVESVIGAELGEFQLLSELASGFLGRVFLCRDRRTDEYFAMKVMSQEAVIAHRQLERVFNEKQIHLLLCSKAAYQVVRLYKTFKDSHNIYLLLEYQPADLFSILNQMPEHVMSEPDCRFLVAVLVLALESCHKNGVVYRDLKPQNILLDEYGYPALTDFGFAKMLNLKGTSSNIPGLPPQTMSFVGTPAYMAPELIKRKYYAEAVDWWALGILLYECLLGDVPFEGDGDYDKLLGEMTLGLSFPETFSPVAKDLIESLLDATPGSRLGAGGSAEVRAHPWFVDVDWEGLTAKTTPSPLKAWIPKRKPGEKPDTQHFDLYKLYEKPEGTDSPAVSPRVMLELFDGF